jgi:proteic killer suppression protein
MLYSRRIKHKGLRLLYEHGDESRISAQSVDRLKRILAALNVITAAEEMDLPGYGFHQLKGNRRGTYALTVTRNWRLTFRWDSDGPFEVNLEDYHGR